MDRTNQLHAASLLAALALLVGCTSHPGEERHPTFSFYDYREDRFTFHLDGYEHRREFAVHLSRDHNQGCGVADELHSPFWVGGDLNEAQLEVLADVDSPELREIYQRDAVDRQIFEVRDGRGNRCTYHDVVRIETLEQELFLSPSYENSPETDLLIAALRSLMTELYELGEPAYESQSDRQRRWGGPTP